jgi:hypothetical protein
MPKQLLRLACAAAAVFVTCLVAVPAADATILRGVWNGDVTDTFTLNNADPIYDNPDEVSYDLIGDAQGYTSVIFFDSTHEGFAVLRNDSGDSGIVFTPPVYDSSNPFTLEPGTYNGRGVVNPASLTLTAVPEPGTWVLMAVGAGLVGAAARGARRKRPAGPAIALA